MKEKFTFFFLGAFIATVAYIAGDMMNTSRAIDAVEEIEFLKVNRILVNELFVTDSIAVSSDEKKVQRFEGGIDLNKMPIGSSHVSISDYSILLKSDEMLTQIRGSGTYTIDIDRGFGSPEPDVIVYGTRTGKRYHRAECDYGYIPMTLEEAKLLWTPCKICNPPR